MLGLVLVLALAVVALGTAVWIHARQRRHLGGLLDAVAMEQPKAFESMTLAQMQGDPTTTRRRLAGKVRLVYTMSVPVFDDPAAGRFGGIERGIRSRHGAYVVDVAGMTHTLYEGPRATDAEEAAAWLADLVDAPLDHR